MSFNRFGLTHTPVFLLATALCWLASATLRPASAEDLGAAYSKTIRPLLDQFCFDCHEGEDAEAEAAGG